MKEEVIDPIEEITPNAYVTDTMALVLWLENRKLPTKVKEVFENVSTFSPHQCIIWIPPIVLAEIGYLSEKGRIDTNLREVEKYMMPPSVCNFRIPRSDFEAIKAAFEIADIPELHDRLIAGVGRALQCKILTNDPKIIGSDFVETLWD